MKKITNSDRFRFLTEKSIKQDKLELTRYQSADLRRKLPRGIYWLQIADGGLVQWNWTLLQDYVVNGDRPEHQRLVEEYISTVSENQEVYVRILTIEAAYNTDRLKPFSYW